MHLLYVGWIGMLLTAIAIISSCFNTYPSCAVVPLDKIPVLCDNIRCLVNLNKQQSNLIRKPGWSLRKVQH